MNHGSDEAIEAFRALHVSGKPLVLYNIWDPGSAKAVAAAGAPALATGSYGVAEAFGAGDGEKLPFADVIANLERIVAVVDVPVSLDLEAGYGADPAAVRASVQQARDAGAVGINMEDRLPGEARPMPLEVAAERIAAAAATGLFVNAAATSSGRPRRARRWSPRQLSAAKPMPTPAPPGCSSPSSPTAPAQKRSARPYSSRSTSPPNPNLARSPKLPGSASPASATATSRGCGRCRS